LPEVRQVTDQRDGLRFSRAAVAVWPEKRRHLERVEQIGVQHVASDELGHRLLVGERARKVDERIDGADDTAEYVKRIGVLAGAVAHDARLGPELVCLGYLGQSDLHTEIVQFLVCAGAEQHAVVTQDVKLLGVDHLGFGQQDDLSAGVEFLGDRLLYIEPSCGVGVVGVERHRAANDLRCLFEDIHLRHGGLRRRPWRLDEPVQIVDRMAGSEEVVHADLVSVGLRQVDRIDGRAAALQMLDQAPHGELHLGLGHHVRVVDDVYMAALERHIVPVGEQRRATLCIAALPVPDTEEGDGAEAARGEGVGFLLPLGDPEIHGGVAEISLAGRRAVNARARALGSLVLENAARAVPGGHGARVVRAVNEERWLGAVRRVERE